MQMARITNSSIYLIPGTPVTENKCLLSLDNVSPLFYERFEVITNVIGVVTYYNINAFREHYEHHRTMGTEMIDPLRNFRNLYFMVPRLLKMLNIPNEEKTVNHSTESDIRMDLLEMYMVMWRNHDFSIPTHGIYVGFDAFLQAGLVHQLNADQATEMLSDERNHFGHGSFLLRTSSMSSADPVNDAATVFTISHVLADGSVQHIRYISLHKVGVYRITSSYDRMLPAFNCNVAALPNFSAKTVLEALQYNQPHSACIIDELDHLNALHYIDLSKFLGY